MEILNTVVNFILGLGGGVVLPFTITILGLFFKLDLFDSFKNGLKIGAGFTGINLVIGTLCGALDPVVQTFKGFDDGRFTIVDIGWEGMGSLAWSTWFAILLVPMGMIMNFVLIKLRVTKTMDVDVWNYWHEILGAAIAFYALKALGWSDAAAGIAGIVIGLVTLFLVLKGGDLLGPAWQEYYGLPGTACCNSDAYLSWGIGYGVCWLLDRIPGVNKIDIDGKFLSEKFGTFGETSVITFFCGILLSVIAGVVSGSWLDASTVISMSVTLAACIILVPKMVGLLMEGLVPISNAARKFFKKALGDDYDIYIGMDEALYLGDETGIQVSVIMIPLALALAFLPGVKVFPIASLGSLCYTTCAMSMPAKGDVFKTLVASCVSFAYSVECYSFLAPLAQMLCVASASEQYSGLGNVCGSGLEELQCLVMGIITKVLGAW